MRCLRAICAILLCLLLPACDDKGKYEEIQRETGYRGPARQNPYLAAERLLEELGCTVSQASSFAQLPFGDATVITPLQSFLSYGDTQAALDWVKRGGHLIVLLGGGEPWRDDWRSSAGDTVKSNARDDEEQRFLDAMEIHSWDAETVDHAVVKVGGRNLSAELHGQIRFSKPTTKSDVRSENALVSFRRGSGRVTLLAQARPFRNRYLADYDHAALLHTLATMEGREMVCFLNGARISFLAMLWDRAWMAMLALGVLLLAWLWRNLARFGPTFTPGERTAREFTGHLRMAGAYLWRRREIRALLEPLQREVRTALARRGFVPDDEASYVELAARTGLPLERVRLAIVVGEPSGAPLFLRTVQDLQTIRAKI